MGDTKRNIKHATYAGTAGEIDDTRTCKQRRWWCRYMIRKNRIKKGESKSITVSFFCWYFPEYEGVCFVGRHNCCGEANWSRNSDEDDDGRWCSENRSLFDEIRTSRTGEHIKSDFDLWLMCVLIWDCWRFSRNAAEKCIKIDSRICC